MEIDIIGLISACSYALDCIEAELVNIKNKHGKRVAYISVRMGPPGQRARLDRAFARHIGQHHRMHRNGHGHHGTAPTAG